LGLDGLDGLDARWQAVVLVFTRLSWLGQCGRAAAGCARAAAALRC
jgi:hypothetical protein